jgi:uncharacterized membrane protein YjgN (DUF898 family)
MDNPQNPAAMEVTESVHESPELTLAFHCTSREYFRIWAVNLCLTLLTLGIFSAWAKVRKKRYFYSHITLDGTPFQYLGQPIPILKGRIIAAVLFLVYYISSNFFTSLMPMVLIVGTVLAPWVIVRSAAFNARYSAYRNMTFSYQGSYRDALKAIYWLGLIPAIVAGSIFEWWGNWYLAGLLYGLFGLTFPWWLNRLKHLVVDHTVYGDNKADLSSPGKQFFKIYFIAGLIMAGLGMLGALMAPIFFLSNKTSPYGFFLILLPMYIGYVLGYAYIQAHASNLVWGKTRLGPIAFQSTLTARGLAKLYLTNAIAIIVSVGLLTPWAVIRTLKYRADHIRVLNHGELTEFTGGDKTAVQAAGAEVGEFFDVDLSL